MDRIFALVDYDNQRSGWFRSGARPGIGANYRDHEDYIRSLVVGLLEYRKNDCERVTSSLTELHIRLYAGWFHEDGALSEMGRMAQKAISNTGRSWRVGNTRIFIELVDRLIDTEDMLWGTYRTIPWGGVNLLHTGPPKQCISPATDCNNILSLISWTRGRCPERVKCNAKASDIFLFESQKLVDTMIVSDAILAHFHGAQEIVAVSMDDDIVPAALAVAALNGPISILRFGRVNPGLYDSLLARKKVPVLDRPALR